MKKNFVGSLASGGMAKLGTQGGVLGSELSKSLAPQFDTYKVEAHSEMSQRISEGQLDLYVEEVKERRKLESLQGFSQGLFPPIRVARTEISKLTLNRWGVLSLSIPYERHVFWVGFSKSRKLRNALRDLGLNV
jgi:hypothetical protein